jgi:PAS domain S-box-containing protein
LSDSGVSALHGDASQLRAAVDASSSGILIIDAAGTITLVNAALTRMTGYSEDELVGSHVDILVPDGFRGAHEDRRAAFVATPRARPMAPGRDVYARRKDGSAVPVEIGLNTVQTERGPLVVASIADLTERRTFEDERQQAVEDRLAFERLLMELSIEFVRTPSDRLDGSIADSLRRLAEFLDLDRSTLWLEDRAGDVRYAIGWTRPGFPPVTARISSREQYPWCYAKAMAGELNCIPSVARMPDVPDRENMAAFGIKSSVIVPLTTSAGLSGAVTFGALREEKHWTPEVVNRFRLIASVFGGMLARRQADEALRNSLAEVSRLRDQLSAENTYLRKEVQERVGGGHIIGNSAAVRRVLEQAQQVAATDSTVLLLGETGSGKEMFATEIHRLSARHQRAMVRVNCAAIPATLMESELFGREKGAYTGAMARQIGRFELADHSTIFLDEIGDLAPDVQVKLLRVLEERQIERLGNPRPIRIDTRIIAATHRHLEERVADGTFREDLFYRLNVFPIRVPPLRERVEDIPLLVWRFVEEFSRAFGKTVEMIDTDSMAALQAYSWPGNIRELRNVVERAMIVAAGQRLSIAVPDASPASARQSPKIKDVEKEHFRKVLESTGWRIRGAGGAAERLGLRPTTLEARLAKLGLKRPVSH